MHGTGLFISWLKLNDFDFCHEEKKDTKKCQIINCPATKTHEMNFILRTSANHKIIKEFDLSNVFLAAVEFIQWRMIQGQLNHYEQRCGFKTDD